MNTLYLSIAVVILLVIVMLLFIACIFYWHECKSYKKINQQLLKANKEAFEQFVIAKQEIADLKNLSTLDKQE